MRLGDVAATLAAMALVADGGPAVAQQAASSSGTYLADSASPFGSPGEAGDASSVKMPDLAFKSDGTEAANFDKYYAFHRADTDFATAFADVAECDGYARGLQSGIGYAQTPYPYNATVAGAIGGALGSVMAEMIFGSAERRRMRRVNMRTCMNFKGYERYGLPKDVWDKFNFEEGLSGLNVEKRRGFLKQQALVASSGKLQGKALGL